jgi:hypothetical protein
MNRPPISTTTARDERAKLTDEPERAVTISGPFDD